MKTNPIIIDVLFGGQSEEHDVSVISSISIINNLYEIDDKFIVYPIYITKKGTWKRSREKINSKVDENFLKNLEKTGIIVSPSLNPEQKIYFTQEKNGSFDLPNIYFPVLHGTNGEDGVIQGLFKVMNIPFVGCGVLGGACGMDKEVMRRLFQSKGIPLLPWISFTKFEWENKTNEILNNINVDLKYPLFIKPANLGSSIGILKANDEIELKNAIENAFLYDNKILVEQGDIVREIECSVLGNDEIRVSCLGEIVPGADFYDFNDKYNSSVSKLEIPASLSSMEVEKIKTYACEAYRVINACGLSRIDFFISKSDGSIFINEINTFPGFTNISMYPKLWEHSGISFKILLEELIELGFQNFNSLKIIK